MPKLRESVSLYPTAAAIDDVFAIIVRFQKLSHEFARHESSFHQFEWISRLIFCIEKHTHFVESTCILADESSVLIHCVISINIDNSFTNYQII